jgi:hypothetical protein
MIYYLTSDSLACWSDAINWVVYKHNLLTRFLQFYDTNTTMQKMMNGCTYHRLLPVAAFVFRRVQQLIHYSYARQNVILMPMIQQYQDG